MSYIVQSVATKAYLNKIIDTKQAHFVENKNAAKRFKGLKYIPEQFNTENFEVIKVRKELNI